MLSLLLLLCSFWCVMVQLSPDYQTNEPWPSRIKYAGCYCVKCHIFAIQYLLHDTRKSSTSIFCPRLICSIRKHKYIQYTISSFHYHVVDRNKQILLKVCEYLLETLGSAEFVTNLFRNGSIDIILNNELIWSLTFQQACQCQCQSQCQSTAYTCLFTSAQQLTFNKLKHATPKIFPSLVSDSFSVQNTIYFPLTCSREQPKENCI